MQCERIFLFFSKYNMQSAQKWYRFLQKAMKMKRSIPAESEQVSCLKSQNCRFFRIISEVPRIISELFRQHPEAFRSIQKHPKVSLEALKIMSKVSCSDFTELFPKYPELFQKHANSIQKQSEAFRSTRKYSTLRVYRAETRLTVYRTL